MQVLVRGLLRLLGKTDGTRSNKDAAGIARIKAFTAARCNFFRCWWCAAFSDSQGTENAGCQNTQHCLQYIATIHSRWCAAFFDCNEVTAIGSQHALVVSNTSAGSCSIAAPMLSFDNLISGNHTGRTSSSANWGAAPRWKATMASRKAVWASAAAPPPSPAADRISSFTRPMPARSSPICVLMAAIYRIAHDSRVLLEDVLSRDQCGTQLPNLRPDGRDLCKGERGRWSTGVSSIVPRAAI